MNKQKAIATFNQLGLDKIPFLFIIDYAMQNIIIKPLDEVDPKQIRYAINHHNNIEHTKPKHSTVHFKSAPVSFEEYKKAFNQVKNHLNLGNSYLTNLTFKTPVDCNLSLQTIFENSNANYRLWYKDEFVVFSPEIFVKIIDGKIFSFPMKGTIDATIRDAENIILNNPKEAAEHATIVDLIRNDLSQIAENVNVDQYRYIDKLKTNQGELLQVSSKISGDLTSNYHEKLGDLFFKLLPAGSICGAPKEKTLSIIDEAENYKRNYYTGIMGVFDGKNLDSGVMIRFIEKQNNQLYFKSGGGITANSDALSEYNEMVQKIYLPF